MALVGALTKTLKKVVGDWVHGGVNLPTQMIGIWNVSLG